MTPTLEARVRDVFAFPEVVLHADGIDAGVRWEITGTAAGRSWRAASGTQTVFTPNVDTVDTLAPLGLPVTYTLTVGVRSATAGPVTRSAAGVPDVVTSADGRVGAHIIRQHTDSRTYRSDVSVQHVPGRPDPVVLEASIVWDAPLEMTLRTVHPHTSTLRALLTSGRRVVVLHQHGVLCRMEHCTVRPVVSGYAPAEFEESLLSWKGVEGRSWPLTITPAALPWDHTTPPVTWADVEAHFPSYARVAADETSFATLQAGRWLG